jgi:hypothetical protein
MNLSLFPRLFRTTGGKLIVLVGLLACAAIPQSRASVSAMYRTPQHSNLGATVDFDFSISGASVTDANGQTEVDQIQKYIVSVSGGPSWTYQLSGGQFYTGSFVDPRGGISTPGIYTFTLVAYGDRPFAYDQWVEGHEDPNDPEVWIEAHQEVGIDWSYGEIGRASLVFYIGVSATPLFLTQPSSCEVTLGKKATFVVSTVAEYSQTYRWQRRTSPGAAWLDINEDAMISILSSSSASGATSNALTIVAIVPGQNGSQFRCIASTSSGSTTSDLATLSVRTEALTDNPLLSLSYAASQIYPVPASPRFDISFQAGTYTATSGEQQSDWINAFTVAASDGWAFTYTRYNAPTCFIGSPIPFERSLTLSGTYIYIVTVVADHPEPYDRWIEGHWEPLYENPEDPEDVTYEWVDAHREIGFEWYENTPIASEILPFFVGTFTAQTSAPPVVIRQPDPATVDENGVAKFRVAVLAEALPTFRWQRMASGASTWTDVSDGSGFSGTTTPNLTVTATAAMNGSQFRCAAANAVGSAVSSGASLTVSLYSPPAFVQHPASVDVLEGTGVTLSVVTSGYPEPTYAWEGSYDGVTGWMDAGGGRTKQIATYPGYHGYFRCIATNSRGTATSSVAEVKTHPYVVAPAIAQHPTNQTTDAGWGVWLHVLATGTSLSYQWQQSWMPNSDWLNLSNNSTYQDVTTDTLKVTSPAMSMNGLYYRCVVSNSAGTAASNPALLTVQVVFGITQQPQNLTLAAGASGAFVVSAIGDPAPGYWWQRWDGTDWRDYGFDSHYSGVITSTLTVSNAEMAMTGARFRCFVNSGSRSVTSNEVTLTVGPPAPANQTITFPPISNRSVNSSPFTLSATASSGLPVTYSLISGPASLSGNTVTILGVGSITIRASQPGNSSYNPAPGVDQSFDVSAGSQPSFGIQPQSVSVAAGNNANFSASVTGSPAPSLQWQRWPSGGGTWSELSNGGSYSGVTTTTLTVIGTTTGMSGDLFRCFATNSAGSATSNSATLTINSSSADITTGQVGRWAFDEGSGLAAEDSAGNNTGTLVNSPSWVAGRSSYALSFNGSSSHVSIPASSALEMGNSGVTIATWVRNEVSYTSEKMLLEHSVWGASNTYQLTTFGNSTLAFNFPSLHGNDGSLTTSFNFSDGAWHHVVAAFDDAGNSVSLYVDGTLRNSKTSNQSIGVAGPSPTYIGSRGGSSHFFPGQLDDVRIYNRALTPADVSELFNMDGGAGSPPSFGIQPQSVSVTPGNNANFSASVTGSPAPSLQWQRWPSGGGTWSNLSNGGSYSGVTTTTLTVSGTTTGMSGDQFQCVATNSAGSATSDPATLTVSLAAPLAHAGEQVTASQFLASWSPVPGAIGYRLDVATNPAFTNLILDNFAVVYLVNGQLLNGTSHMITGLASNTDYYYRVRVITNAGTSPSSNSIYVRTFGNPSTSLPPSLWFDLPLDVHVNGVWTKVYDGIADEVVPSGGPHGLTYYVLDWTYTGGSVSFDYSDPVNDYWYYRAVNLDANGDGTADASSPDFTPWWLAGGTVFTYLGDTWFRIGVEFNPEPGYVYDICYSENDIVSVKSLSRVNGGTNIYSDSGDRLIFALFNLFTGPELDGGSLYLVRYGKPIGSLDFGSLTNSMTLGTGTVTVPGLGTVTTSGTGTVLVPAGGSAILSVKDAVGKVLQAGPQVVWEVWDLVTNTKLNIGGQSVSLDLGVDLRGNILVGAKLDDQPFKWFVVDVKSDVTMITPAGDPVDAPVEAGSDPNSIPDGANEFTYSSGLPGVLTIKLKARVRGIGNASAAEREKYKFVVTGVGDSAMAWDAANPVGAPTINGDFIEATVRFTNLPTQNSAFGPKIARVLFRGFPAVDQSFEVFYRTLATNHPGNPAGTLNWFYYWMQTPANLTAGAPTVYNNAALSFYNFPFEDKIYIGSNAPTEAPDIWGNPKGIDGFAWYTAHEAKHRSQMAELWPNGYQQTLDQDTDGVIPANRTGDDIPDSAEPTYMPGRPYYPTKYATYPDTLGYGQNPLPDREDINIRSKVDPTAVDILWTNGNANSSDWSNPGKNSRDDTFR